jgi:hypothetical protein
MSALSCGSGLPSSVERIDPIGTSGVKLLHHMHLIVPHYEFSVSSVSIWQPSYSSLYDLALRRYCWDFIVVFLYRRQINVSS